MSAQPRIYDNVFLVGFMGAGKSTVGSILADQIGWKFVDTDRLVVKAADASIAEIFEKNGERHFRKLESDVIRETSRESGLVVALGGGSLMNARNRYAIWGPDADNLVVYLSARTATLRRRLRKEQEGADQFFRPLLKSRSVEKLFRARKRFYRRADLEVSTDGKAPEQVIAEIIRSQKLRWG